MGRSNRVEVRLSDTREERLEEVCGTDEDGNLKRDKSAVIRELIDKEYFQEWHIQILEEFRKVIRQEVVESGRRFDMEDYLRTRVGNEKHIVDMEEVVKKMRGR